MEEKQTKKKKDELTEDLGRVLGEAAYVETEDDEDDSGLLPPMPTMGW